MPFFNVSSPQNKPSFCVRFEFTGINEKTLEVIARTLVTFLPQPPSGEPRAPRLSDLQAFSLPRQGPGGKDLLVLQACDAGTLTDANSWIFGEVTELLHEILKNTVGEGLQSPSFVGARFVCPSS